MLPLILLLERFKLPETAGVASFYWNQVGALCVRLRID